MIENTVSHIFLVVLTIGYNCCDRIERTLRAFSHKGDAESYKSDMQRQIEYNRGLYDAVSHMVREGWEKVNPVVEYPDYNDSDYDVKREAHDAYLNARSAEYDRLLALVGWKKELDLHYESEYHLHIQEVPFGFEVVKPAEEEQVAAE